MVSRQPNEEDLVSLENPNTWIFHDYGLLEDIPVSDGDIPSLDPSAFIWSSHPLTCSTRLSIEFNESFGNSDNLNETGFRKRVRPGTYTASGSKACREKMRRDRLNDRFLELGSILDPGRPAKVDKAVILVDAVRMVTQLRDEAQKLRESNESLKEKINELKAEKNELRDEKQRLKTEKENLERQVNALGSHQDSYLILLLFQLHILPQAKLLVARWCPLLAILEFPCGSSCLLLLLTHHRIIFSTLQSHRLAGYCFGSALAQKTIVLIISVIDLGGFSLWSVLSTPLVWKSTREAMLW